MTPLLTSSSVYSNRETMVLVSASRPMVSGREVGATVGNGSGFSQMGEFRWWREDTAGEYVAFKKEWTARMSERLKVLPGMKNWSIWAADKVRRIANIGGDREYG